MFSPILSALARVRIALGFGAVLAAVSTALVILGPRVREDVIRHMSTNVHNLSHGRLGTLLGSAFVNDAGPVYVWLPWLVCLLALAELLWHGGRVAMVFFIGHIGATLLVAAGLVAAIKMRWLPISITHASDVGMSYGAMAVLGALTAAIPARWRPAWIGWWLAIGAAAVAVGDDFTDAGHTVALVLGMLIATRLRKPVYWTPVRYALLAGSAGFGFLLLAHTGWASLAAAIAGPVGALTVGGIARLRV
ncbi:MAG: rhomboid-like protein, partial [Mycobacterium sp.]|uniref:rhomboid-like protein n=1 Tax=Mycobacterium sp. TaxID=1785 RepID=UPI003CC5D58E